MKRAATLAMVLGSIAILSFSLARPSAPTTVAHADGYTVPYPNVGMSSHASAAEKAAAKEIADAIGPSGVIESDRNPVCCIWIEISGWTPNPGERGYVIINQSGGSIVSASDENQLRAAVDRFKQSIRKTGDKIEVPIGLLTNYPVVPASGK